MIRPYGGVAVRVAPIVESEARVFEMRSRAPLVFIVLCCLAAPPVASAQEAAPIPLGVALASDGDMPLALLARDVGLIVRSQDADYELLCARLLGLSGSSGLELVGLPDNTLLVGSYRGVRENTGASCDWPQPDDPMADFSVSDSEPAGNAVRLLVRDDDGAFLVVERAHDGGPLTEVFDLPPEPIFFSMRTASAAPARTYLSAVTSSAADDGGLDTQRWVYRTDDGGDTFDAWAFDDTTGARLEIVAIDPDDPDRVYVAAVRNMSSHDHGGESEVVDRVFRSDNGGRDFELIFEPRVFGGLVVDGEGTLWVGDIEGGLHRSDDGGRSFETLDEDLHVSCLRHREGKLFACADSARGDAFSFGVSEDGGASFRSLLRFDDVRAAVTCTGAAEGLCDAAYESYAFWHPPSAGATDASVSEGSDAGEDAGERGAMDAGKVSPRDSGRASPASDAGSDPADAHAETDATTRGSSNGSDCGCRTPGRRAADPAPWWAALMLGWGVWRRASRRPR